MSIVPPPPSKGAKSSQTRTTTSQHVRRVTLNLIRHAGCCPPELTQILAKLSSDEIGWDMRKLDRAENEMIYAMVDEELGKKATAEFEADTDSIIDHRKCDAFCKLCGHQHIRFEFTLRNKAGGRDTQTGSTCIEEYGINVDGEATAEDAIRALRGAISKAKRRADADDWKLDHPSHEADFATLREHRALLAINQHPVGLWSYLKPQWKRRVKKTISALNQAIKYYDKNGMLTPKRTLDVYLPGGLLVCFMVDELKAAQAKKGGAKGFWVKFIADNPTMNSYQRRSVDYLAARAYEPSALYQRNKDLLAEIRRQNNPTSTTTPTTADNSDLPY